jgi:hypothetical protein
MYTSDTGFGYVYIIYPQKRMFTKIFLYINDFCMCAIRRSCLHTDIPGGHTNCIFYLPPCTYSRFAVKSRLSGLCMCKVTAFLVYKYHIFKDIDITPHPPNGISTNRTPFSFFFYMMLQLKHRLTPLQVLKHKFINNIRN